MRIGFITDSYRPRISGVVVSIAALAEQFRALGHTVHIVAPRVPGHVDGEPGVHRMPSIPLPGYPDFPVFRPDGRAFAELAARHRLEIIHAHSPFLAGAMAMAASARTGAPVVFTHHTRYVDYVHYAPWIPAPAARWFVHRHVRAFCARVDRVVAPSAALRMALVRDGVSTPIHAIPTGSVDVAAIRGLAPHARSRAGIPDGAPLAVTVSRLTPEKSVDAVLDAFAAVDRRAVLLVIGGGPLAPALAARAAELGIAGRTRFLGALPHVDVLRWMKAADLFLFASRTETQGMVIAEAMACGLPVAAVAGPGVEEAVVPGETGALTPPNELGAAADRLLRDAAARGRMAARAREAAAAYDRAAIADRFLAVYHAALEARGSAR